VLLALSRQLEDALHGRVLLLGLRPVSPRSTVFGPEKKRQQG
jgi:hypothetical protein